MNNRDHLLTEELQRLRTQIGSDFCSLGLLEGYDRLLKWKLASGNVNDRFLSIIERPGRGLSGSVVKVGRAMQLNVPELVAARQLHEYAVLLAENLRSAYAIPLFIGNQVTGILLAGDRKRRIYRTEERNQIALAGERITQIVAEQAVEPKSS
ncbi:GAF domain-containing protein [Cohnella kolymensis]|uniref:GAF domain-containing protein n=1 Tax=Cohnella kolymensis TaxID=1590652 RepID=UPI00069870FA|nr:GAF domain-containing protein [Cohnella kolymensis]